MTDRAYMAKARRGESGEPKSHYLGRYASASAAESSAEYLSEKAGLILIEVRPANWRELANHWAERFIIRTCRVAIGVAIIAFLVLWGFDRTLADRPLSAVTLGDLGGGLFKWAAILFGVPIGFQIAFGEGPAPFSDS